jgi:hypothetical protein
MTESPSRPRSYAAPDLTPRQRELLNQGRLPFLLRFGGRTHVNASEISKETGLSPDLFYDLVQIGKLEVIKASAKGKSDRKTYVFTTRSVILWMLSNSNLDETTFAEDFRLLVDLQPRAVLEDMLRIVQARLARIR